MAEHDFPVGIVGAGPTGLACALRLTSFGIPSVVLEAEPRLHASVAAACRLQGDVLEILDKVGLGEAILAGGGPTGFPPWIDFDQYRTQQLILDKLAGTPAQVRWSHRVVAVAVEDDQVRVRMSTPDGLADLRCRYLVAADGIASDVRRLLDVPWTGYGRGDQHVVNRMQVGPVFLAGDAAHALAPAGARGLNSGIQDADNLAWKLDLVLSGRAPESLLETYHIERHAAARENARLSETVRRRRLALRRAREANIYRDSPIVASRPDNPLVGRLAPDGEVQVAGRATRLRRLLGKEFVGLYFGLDPQDARQFAYRALAEPMPVPLRLHLVLPAGVQTQGLPQRASVVHEVVDGAGPRLRAAYRTERPCWYLVRPDGHVAAGHHAEFGPAITTALRDCIAAAPA